MGLKRIQAARDCQLQNRLTPARWIVLVEIALRTFDHAPVATRWRFRLSDLVSDLPLDARTIKRALTYLDNADIIRLARRSKRYAPEYEIAIIDPDYCDALELIRQNDKQAENTLVSGQRDTSRPSGQRDTSQDAGVVSVTLPGGGSGQRDTSPTLPIRSRPKKEVDLPERTLAAGDTPNGNSKSQGAGNGNGNTDRLRLIELSDILNHPATSDTVAIAAREEIKQITRPGSSPGQLH